MIDEFVRDWIAKALDDLKVAAHIMNMPEGEVVSWAVCFHCQQAVEKLLKAYLSSKNIDFKRTHDLKYLLQLCADEDPEFGGVEVGDLSSYATIARYPGLSYEPTLEDAGECLRIATAVKEFVLRKLGLSS